MKRKSKLIAGAVLVSAILVVSYAFALLIASHSFTNTMSIKGVGVTVLEWIDDSTQPTIEVSSHDWGTVAGGQTVYYQYVCVENTGTEGLTLTFSTTLSPSIGSVTWQIEQKEATTWEWKDWASKIADSDDTIPGSTELPFAAGQVLGMRSATPEYKEMGRIRLAITIDSEAAFGAVPAFSITITGTEVTA